MSVWCINSYCRQSTVQHICPLGLKIETRCSNSAYSYEFSPRTLKKFLLVCGNHTDAVSAFDIRHLEILLCYSIQPLDGSRLCCGSCEKTPLACSYQSGSVWIQPFPSCLSWHVFAARSAWDLTANYTLTRKNVSTSRILQVTPRLL